MDEKELEEKFGQEGWKQFPDEIYLRYRFTPAKIEVEGTPCEGICREKDAGGREGLHLECLLKKSLVFSSLAAAVMNAKYVNAIPLNH